MSIVVHDDLLKGQTANINAIFFLHEIQLKSVGMGARIIHPHLLFLQFRLNFLGSIAPWAATSKTNSFTPLNNKKLTFLLRTYSSSEVS